MSHHRCTYAQAVVGLHADAVELPRSIHRLLVSRVRAAHSRQKPGWEGYLILSRSGVLNLYYHIWHKFCAFALTWLRLLVMLGDAEE